MTPPSPVGWSRRPLSGVRAVLFDYGMTLVSFTAPRAALERAHGVVVETLAAAGHQPPSAAALQAAVHDRVDAEVAAHAAAENLEEIDVGAAERRAFAALGMQLDDHLLDECSRLVQEAWLDGVAVYPDVLPALSTLRRAGLRLGIASNAPYRPSSMRHQLECVGLAALVDASLFSGELGWRKPSPRFFAEALRGLGTTAPETLHVGDRVREDIEGAHAAGMPAVLLARGVTPARVCEVGPAAPEAMVASLDELVQLLVDGVR